jgi:hypothetical protein
MTAEEIIAIYAPEMSALPNLLNRIALAEQQTSLSFFGGNYTLAVALRAMHLWALNTVRAGSDAGIVTYKAEGRLMLSYGGTGVIRDEFELTNFGRELKKLIHTTGLGIMITSEEDLYAFVDGAF